MAASIAEVTSLEPMNCNTINLWKQLISRISQGSMISALNESRMVQCTVFYYTHTKAQTTLAVFSSSAVSLYDDINTQISSPAALRVTSLAFYRLI